MAKRKLSLKPGEREPTFAEWHQILTEIIDPSENLVQQTVEYFLRTSESGKAYLEGAKRLRPSLKIGLGDLDLDEVLSTYDAMTLLGQLIAEPRCGTDPTFKVWKDIWHDPSRGPSPFYTFAVDIARGLEARAQNDEERARLAQVRTVLQNEFSLEVRFEEYLTFRQEFAKRKTKR